MGFIDELCQLQEDESLDLCQVKEIVSRATFCPEDLRESAPQQPEPDHYSRTSIYSCDAFEVLVIRWAPEAQTTPHNHGCDKSCGVAAIIEGGITNRVFCMQENGVKELECEQFEAGSLMAFEEGIIHQMENSKANQETLSVHVYFPKLSDVTHF